jgi:ferredoxin/flavodoxin---NADP+ reductase
MFKIIDMQMIVPNVHQMAVEAPEVVREAAAGQFVIIRAEEGGERIPLTLTDWDKEHGTITLVFINIGATTNRLSQLHPGDLLPTVVGPLGLATEVDKFGTVVCIGGCYGIASIYPVARSLKEKGNTVITIIEARSSYLLYWEDKLRTVSDKLVCITRDGSKGYRGHITRLTEILSTMHLSPDRIIINGCTYLSRRGSDITRPFGIKTIVSLAPIMIDGTGMCGVCRVTVGKETRFACVHGPDFDGHEVDWDEFFQRRQMYMAEELVPLRSSGCESRFH